MDRLRSEGGDGAADAADRADRRAVLRQRLYPKRLLSALALHLTRSRFGPWKRWQIRWFSRRYGVDVAEAAEPDPLAYPDFNSFFTRALRPGCRPVEGSGDDLVSPADGTLSRAGRVEDGTLLQAKGMRYRLDALLGGDVEGARRFAGGVFATVYLSPRDYHRVHMPIAGHLREMVYVPGALFSVNPRTTRALPDLFARNERVACVFDTALGPLAMVLVAAVLVGGVEVVWHGPVMPPRGRRVRTWRYDVPGTEPVEIPRAGEMGRFNMGSTVIVVLGNPDVEWAQTMVPGASVRVGQRMGSPRSRA